MTLKKRLDAIREASRAKFPEEAKAIMAAGVEKVRASGILDSMAAVGAKAPQFQLESSDGRAVSLSNELAKGPVVLTFFRGAW